MPILGYFVSYQAFFPPPARWVISWYAEQCTSLAILAVRLARLPSAPVPVFAALCSGRQL